MNVGLIISNTESALFKVIKYGKMQGLKQPSKKTGIHKPDACKVSEDVEMSSVDLNMLGMNLNDGSNSGVVLNREKRETNILNELQNLGPLLLYCR